MVIAVERDVTRYLTASTMQRLGALLVDILLFIVTVMVPATLISWWFGPADLTTCEIVGASERCTSDPEAVRFTQLVGYGLAAVWVFVYAAAITTGASVGKRATEILVVDVRSGETIGYGRALVRTVVSVVGLAFFGVGLWFTLTNKHRRALHDLATGTRVISP